MKVTNKKTISNTIMLYIISIVKLILPLITLPYLTRILSEESYGFISYVKNCMTYMQLIIDFGFILSSVKDIVRANGDKNKINVIVGNTIVAKCILSIASLIVLVVMIVSIKILQIDILFVILSFLAVFLTAFYGDFFFRGIEKMYFITIIFLISKGISTVLTFFLVKDDSSIWLIPVLDIAANLISGIISIVLIYKQGYKITFGGFRECFHAVKDSFTYFLSMVATTAFSALNTLIIGIYITDLVQVAHWSLCISIISAIQALYSPICNGIYPQMIRDKKISFIHKVMKLFMPIVTAGCVFSFFFAPVAMEIVGGEKYIIAADLFRWMIPILFFSFPAQVYGWPTLGAIGKEKETTISTIVAAVAQVVGIFALIVFGGFSLVSLAILRFSTELLLMSIRMYFTYKNKKLFTGDYGVATS